jgi:holo-[acyl-carrier protein] synthase
VAPLNRPGLARGGWRPGWRRVESPHAPAPCFPLASTVRSASGRPWAALILRGAVVGVGVDLVDVERLRTALARTPSLAARLFTEGERAALAGRRDPMPHLAARFAAKEAVMKALGRGLATIELTDIEVVVDEHGAPQVMLYGSAAERAAELGVGLVRVSLTHTGSLAQAFAVAVAGR